MKKIIIPILLCLASVASLAQSNHIDSRNMKRLEGSKIPVLKSFNDLRTTPGALTKSAVTIGNAEFVASDAVKLQMSKNNIGNAVPGDLSLWRIMRADNGTANWMWRASVKTKTQKIQSVSGVSGIEVLQGLKTALRIVDPKSEFFQMSSSTDELECKHLRFGQQFQGVPVWNRDLYVHFDASGEPYIINGTYESTPKNVSTDPSVSNSYSILVAIADLKSLGRWAPVGPDVAKVLGFTDPIAKLVLYPEAGNKFRLVYEVSIIPNLLESYFYLIDATSGEIITKIARQCSIIPTDPKMPPVTIAHFGAAGNSTVPVQPQSGFTNASGIDLNGTTQQLRTYQHSDGKYYAIWDLSSLNAGASALPDQPSGGAMTLTLNNQDYNQNSTIFHNTSSNNSWADPTVVSAHHNTLVTYNYYNSTFSRKAIDDKNGTIVAMIHVTQNGAGMDNAFWNGAGKAMIYGDGNTEFKPLAGGIDVAGHEMTHGVINNTADLVYQFQSGALNESFADVFGVMVDTRNLTIGEDIMRPGKGSCLRDMNDPHNTSGNSHQPAHMSEFNQLDANSDNGGVHVNSGIPNRACAILINQLGRDKVQRMYYRALSMYLTRNSQFTDCRIAVQSAAKDLFGASSGEFNAVGPAFDAVGITGPGSNMSENDIPAQTGGMEYVAFTNSAGDIGFLDPSNGHFVMSTTPGSVARVSNSGSSRAQLSAPRTGKNLWFVSPTGHLNFMEVASGNVKTFPNLHVQSDGDLWNAAVSPDESYVALTSSHNNDPNIYIFDGTNVFVQPLKPENTDGGALATIDYPDVIAWSPNKNVARLSFDAYLSTNLGGTAVNYWSMYEINYDSKKTYDLIPAQTTNVDIGNVAYSNTSPDIIIFNAISAGVEDIAIANFKTNMITSLNASQYKVNVPITDADKPSFSPSDHQFTFSSALNNSIMFYDFDKSTNPVSLWQFTAPAYMPYWFLLGGSAGVADRKQTESSHLTVYPTTISREATIKFNLNSSVDITVDIVNLFGQSVHNIANERLSSGSHEIQFNIDDLASGTYFVRLATKDAQSMVKVIIAK